MASYNLYPQIQWLDNSGDPLTSGKIYTYQANSTTPLNTYTDSTGGTANANPTIIDSSGFAVLWLINTVNYKIIVHDSTGNVISYIPTLNNVQGLGANYSSTTLLATDMDTNGYSLITTSDNKNITLDPNGSGTIILTGPVTISGLATANANLSVKNGATGPGNINVYEDSDNGSNFTAVKAPSSLADDTGSLTLPTVAVTMPTALPSATHAMTISTAGVIGNTTLPWTYLGALSITNSYADTTFLTGYNQIFFLIKPGSGGLLSDTNNIYWMMQFYIGSYITSAYADYYYGVSSTPAAVSGTNSAPGMSLSYATSGNVKGLLNNGFGYISINPGNTGPYYNLQTAGRMGANLTGNITVSGSLNNSGTITGLKVLPSAGGIDAASTTSILFYGIPSS